MFVSAEYAARGRTRLERRAALAKAVRERRECLPSAQFDDTPLPGLLSDMVTVGLRGRAPPRFAAMIVDKLTALGIAAPVSQVAAAGYSASRVKFERRATQDGSDSPWSGNQSEGDRTITKRTHRL